MIYDHIRNINCYKGMTEALDAGLDFIARANEEMLIGSTELCNGVKAIVSEYKTKENNANGYETHRRNIDIQLPLRGIERIACVSVEKLNEKVAYNEKTDIAFHTSDARPTELTIGEGFFVILFPQDGHKPQLYVGEPELIKKLTLKVPCQ